MRATNNNFFSLSLSPQSWSLVHDSTRRNSVGDIPVTLRKPDENELVSPQSFGGDKGPSTALLAVADPKDLQVEVDLNEADLSKVSLAQPCRITPEAYPEHIYDGYVAEIAPEANRQKGTLQVKVQVKNPDRYLVPELSAKVDFLAAYPAESPSSAEWEGAQAGH